MKFVQIGILACLVTISGLLFAIYRNQQTSTVEASVETASLPESPADLSGFQTEAVVERPAPVVAAPRPQPRPAAAVRQAAVTKPQPAAPAPVAVPEHTPARAPEPVLDAAPAPRPTQVAVVREPAVAVDYQADREPVAAPEPRTVTLDRDTALIVRLENTLSTQRSLAGDEFRATLDDPIVVDGLIIADKGAFVEGRVVEARRAGRVQGRSYLALELTRLNTDDGQWIDLSTSSYSEEGDKTVGKDLKKIGIGSAIGAAVGAIAGGGKGAAIGAGVGAGAGAGATAATRGEPVVLRPETRLGFRLESPVTVTERL